MDAIPAQSHPGDSSAQVHEWEGLRCRVGGRGQKQHFSVKQKKKKGGKKPNMKTHQHRIGAVAKNGCNTEEVMSDIQVTDVLSALYQLYQT